MALACYPFDVSGPHGSLGGRQFPDTRWSHIIAVASADPDARRAHLEELIRRYWRPTYHYIQALRPQRPEDTEDLTQGFFTALLGRTDFSSLSPDRGSFRGFLRLAAQRYVISVDRSEIASRARERALADSLVGGARSAGDPAPGNTPDEVFDNAWARTVLDDMLARLRDELTAAGKELYWTIFREYCVEPAEGVSYDSIAGRHGLGADDVRNYLRAVRQRSRALVREIVADYLLPGDDLEGEVRFILGK